MIYVYSEQYPKKRKSATTKKKAVTPVDLFIVEKQEEGTSNYTFFF